MSLDKDLNVPVQVQSLKCMAIALIDMTVVEDVLRGRLIKT